MSLMESGLLSMEVAKKVYEKKQKNSKLTSPVKAASVTKKIQSATVTKKTPSSAVSSTKTKTTDSTVASRQPKKRKAGDSISEDDFLITRKNTKKQKTS
ncbi:hypothetical protein NC653_005210 [Populus alba x Populus x berolinensis]|uniref:Uncharacterized protein n=1 Tax=Populus alba x Populus x berolinensis TaxID=444605 RepID=A0AAD6WAS5_9ROSI|nr:hypothetical protein NC653_005210 [Populus alba x Populus x berolinensis]